jgi:MFS family permease
MLTTEPLTSLASALSTPPLRRLQLGSAAASSGGWAFMVALSLYAYEAGGAAAVGLAALVRMVPAGLAAPFAGLLADRHSRRDVLVATSVGRAVVVGAVALCTARHASLAVVLPLAALFTALVTAHKPAQAALLPTLARTPHELAGASAVCSAVDNGGFLFGALAAGLAVAVTSPQAAFAGIAGAFVAAAFVLAAVPRDPVPHHRVPESGSGPWRELMLGARIVLANPALRMVGGVATALVVAEGAIDVLIVVTALSLLDTGSSGVGLLNAAWGVGGLVGGAAALVLVGRNRVPSGLALGQLFVLAPLLLIAMFPHATLALLLLALMGVGFALVEVAALTFLQRLTADEVLARAFGTLETGYWLATGLGAMLAPLAVSLLGARGALAAVGGAVAILLGARWAALGRLEVGTPASEREFVLLRALPVFAPLPIAEVETLARRAREVPVSGGQLVFSQGDAGDHFYVIGEGRVAIIRDGVRCAVLGPGDCFGELALLRECPRTATVRALENGLLYGLDRQPFIETVTGHRRAAQAAGRMMAPRLEGAAA